MSMDILQLHWEAATLYSPGNYLPILCRLWGKGLDKEEDGHMNHIVRVTQEGTSALVNQA